MGDPISAVVFDQSSEEEAEYGGDGVIIRGIMKLLYDDVGYDDHDNDNDNANANANDNDNANDDNDNDNDDDDDCVVLDGDLDKPRRVEDGYGDDSEDLVVVSEKGEVACRDFPHPRHCCAKYPFSSSQHKVHCDQCHCYVCDSLAPCVDWGTGISIFDHCHATDKQEKWKSLRALRNVGRPLHIPPSPPVHHSATSMRRPPISDRSPPLVPNLVPRNRSSRQLPPISDPSPPLMPNVVPQNQGLRQRETTVASRDCPHSRHLCEKYPFSSSRHELHCEQCRCYACDSPAPCDFWASGGSSFDHCHASDKHALWKSHRSLIKLASYHMASFSKRSGDSHMGASQNK